MVHLYDSNTSSHLKSVSYLACINYDVSKTSIHELLLQCIYNWNSDPTSHRYRNLKQSIEKQNQILTSVADCVLVIWARLGFVDNKGIDVDCVKARFCIRSVIRTTWELEFLKYQIRILTKVGPLWKHSTSSLPEPGRCRWVFHTQNKLKSSLSIELDKCFQGLLGSHQLSPRWPQPVSPHV